MTSNHAVPNSAGTAPPKMHVPPNAADCHIHVYDNRFEPPVAKPANGTVSDYRQVQKRLGLARVVIVTPRAYGTDNRVTVDAIAQLGIERARGVGVLRPNVTDSELRSLDDGGIRGIRFTLGDPKTAVVSIDMIEPLAARIADLGWHVQLNMEPEQIVEHAGLLRRLPTTLVFDHMGKIATIGGVKHPAYGVIREIVDANRGWVKISGAYINSKIGPPAYPEATPLARAYVDAVPERLVWGSDWPHPGSRSAPPDDAVLLDLLAEWAPDAATRQRILVANPEALYGFPGA